LRAALSGNANALEAFNPPEGAPATLIEMNRQFLISQTAEHRAKIAAIDGQLSQKEAERATTAATVGKIEATIPLLQQRVDVRNTSPTRNTARNFSISPRCRISSAFSRNCWCRRATYTKLNRRYGAVRNQAPDDRGISPHAL